MSGQQINRLFLTNDYSIVSKYSAIKTGYFNDKILEDFIENHLNSKSWRRTPLVNRGYAARLMAMDWVVDRSITLDSIDCFIILGAGYDTLPFRQARKCCWIELDLPQVVEVKSEFITHRNVLVNEDLIQIEPGKFCSTSRNYHLVTCDLRDTVGLKNSLQSVLAHLSDYSKTPKNFAIINEVCLCYIKTDEIQTLLQTVIDSVRKSAHKVQYIGYEQLKPEKESQFSTIMLNHFNSLGHPLKHYPLSEQIHQLLVDNLGFDKVDIDSMHKIFHKDLFNLRNKHAGYQKEPFEEYEEMDLYLSHYALVTASLSIDAQMTPQQKLQDSIGEDCCSKKCLEENVDGIVSIVKSGIQRFGHSSCMLSEKSSCDPRVLTSGGFGISLPSPLHNDQKHRRLSDCFLLLKNQSGAFGVQLVDTEDLKSESIHLDRMHGQICEISENLLFFNGGRQSPIKFNAGIIPFITSLDGARLTVRHKFGFEASKSTFRWRHQMIKIDNEEVIQIGGNTAPTEIYNSCVIMWNLSSDKLGSREISSDSMLFRHSFGMAKRDSRTLLLFGGLQASIKEAMLRDQPVCMDTTVLLWDIREKKPTKQKVLESARSYGSSVHFISEYQFVKSGGISTSDGLASGIEIFDLRQMEQSCVQEFALPVVNGEPMILINATTSHLESERKMITIGGGGNYFTMGTSFNRSHLVFEY